MIAIRWSFFRRKDIKKTKWLLWVRLAIRWPPFTWATFTRMSLKPCFMRNSHKVIDPEMTSISLFYFSWTSSLYPCLSWYDHKKISWIRLRQFPTASWCRACLGYNEFWCYQNQWSTLGMFENKVIVCKRNPFRVNQSVSCGVSVIHHSENLVKETFSSRTWTNLLTTKDRDHSWNHLKCSVAWSSMSEITNKVLYDTFSSFGNILSCKVVDEGDGGRYQCDFG